MLEQLSGLAEITVRPLSGGQGIYRRSWMIERRSSPGLGGDPGGTGRIEPRSCASGIVRVVGWGNFRGDPSQPHHMRMTDIDQAFEVSEATGSAKSMAIRDLLRIARLSPEWTLPSRMEDNPLIWMLKVNGLITDIRLCPREAQMVACEKGLIPYIPADRATDPAEE